MVHYGYDEGTPGYNVERESVLAKRLEAVVRAHMRGVTVDAGRVPFVEVNGRKAGVHIRSLTHISEEVRSGIVADADKVFNDVMGLCYGCGAGVVAQALKCPGCGEAYGSQEGVTRSGAHRRSGVVQ